MADDFTVKGSDEFGVKGAARQRKLADALRKQADTGAPQGQMVGRHFVAPHWSQHLADLANKIGAPYLEHKATKAEEESERKIGEARQKALSSLPQATAAVMGPTTLEGLGGREREVPGAEIEPAKPLTMDRVFPKYFELAGIPGSENIANAYLKGAQEEIKREDTQKEKAEQARLTRENAAVEAEKKRVHDAAIKSQEFANKAEIARNKAQQQDRHFGDRLQHMKESLAWRKEAGEKSQVLQREKFEFAKGEAMKKGGKKEEKLQAAEAANQGLQDAIDSLAKGKDTHALGWFAGMAQTILPGGQTLVSRFRDEETNDAVAAINYWAGEIQHDRFGAALTKTEKNNAAAYLPSEYDDIHEIRRKAKNLQQLIQDNNDRLRGKKPMPPGVKVDPDQMLTEGGGAAPAAAPAGGGGAANPPGHVPLGVPRSRKDDLDRIYGPKS